MEKTNTQQPVKPVRLSLRHCMEKAATDATSKFEKLLTEGVKANTPAAAEMRRKMRQEFDWRSSEFSVKDAIDELEQDAAIYRGIAQEAQDVEMFFDAVHAVAMAHIDLLTFERNNYPEALMRRDQFCHYVDAAAKLFREQGHLADGDDRFEQLINGYDMSMNGYALLRERVSEYSEEQFASLLELARAATAAETAEGQEPDEEVSGQRMMAMYQEISGEYGLTTQSGALLPPAYLYLSDLALTIAVKQARNEMPHERSRDALEERVVKHRDVLMKAMAAVPHDPSELWQLGKPEKVLLEAQAEAFKQPVDFRAHLREATALAGATMMAAVPRLHKESQPFITTIAKASGHKAIQIEGVQTNTATQLEAFARKHAGSIKQDLGEAQTMEDVVVAFEQDADEVLKDCIIALHHPGEILAHRAYAEALGKTMLQHYRDAGLPTQEVRVQFEAIVEKYEHAYASNVEAARWCLVQSEHAYANFGEMALAMVKAQRGKAAYSELTEKDAEQVARVAAQYFIGACQDRQLPEAWCGNMFMPLLYRRAVDHVGREIKREGQFDRPTHFADKVNDPTHHEADQRAASAQTNAAIREMARERLMPVLERTVGMFSQELPHINGWPNELPEDPTQSAPNVDSRTLHDAMAFYEQQRSAALAS